MISKKTKKYYSVTLKQGCLLKLYPFTLNNNKVVIKNYYTVRMFTLFGAVLSAYNALVSAYVGISYIETNKVASFFIGITSGLLLCMGLHVWHLRFMKEIPIMIGEFLNFNSKLRKLLEK